MCRKKALGPGARVKAKSACQSGSSVPSAIRASSPVVSDTHGPEPSSSPLEVSFPEGFERVRGGV